MTTDSDAAPSPADTADATPSGTAPADAPVIADTQAPAPSSGESTASPPDAPVDDRAGLLAVIRDVVAKPKSPEGEGKPAAPELASSDPAPNTTPAADPTEADPTEAELAASAPKTRKRIETLLTQRNTARAEIENLKPAVAKWNQFEGYLTQHDLAAEDVNLLLGIGAALRRGDFEAFRKGVMPYVELANQALGDTLPPDLAAKVEAGEMTQEAAKELSRTRFQNARLQGQAQAQTAAAATREANEAQARASHAISAAVTAWETDTRGRDPDYAKKASAVLRFSQALMAEHGRPRTADEAVAMAKRAYEDVNQAFAAARPAAAPTRPQPNGVRVVNDAQPEPKTLMEAALLGLRRARAS